MQIHIKYQFISTSFQGNFFRYFDCNFNSNYSVLRPTRFERTAIFARIFSLKYAWKMTIWVTAFFVKNLLVSAVVLHNADMSIAKQIINMPKQGICTITGLIPGHCKFIQPTSRTPLAERWSGLWSITAKHIVCEWKEIGPIRQNLYGTDTIMPEDLSIQISNAKTHHTYLIFKPYYSLTHLM